MNKTKNYQLTIIVPVYNEEDNFGMIEKKLSDYIAHASVATCILFVDDGSTDQSLKHIIEICNNNSNFYYISFEKNCGLSAAVKAGIDYAQSPLTGYIDADLQTDPEDFELLLKHTNDYPLVIGIRANRKDTWWKRRQSRFANSFRRMMTGDTAVDTGCPLKIIRSDVAKKIPFFKGLHRFIPAMVQLQGLQYKQVKVRHRPRTAGVSKFSMRNRFWGPLADCFAFRWMRKRYINYIVATKNV
ncbi:MAG: glycosyltransferase family 2 protein [Bacteroidaceae bacterium]